MVKHGPLPPNLRVRRERRYTVSFLLTPDAPDWYDGDLIGKFVEIGTHDNKRRVGVIRESRRTEDRLIVVFAMYGATPEAQAASETAVKRLVEGHDKGSFFLP